MTTPKDRPEMGPIEVITSVQRRRRWSPEQKRSILEEGEQPGNSLIVLSPRTRRIRAPMLPFSKARLGPSAISIVCSR